MISEFRAYLTFPLRPFVSVAAAVTNAAPVFVKNLENVEALLGAVVNLNAVVTGIPSPNVQW